MAKRISQLTEETSVATGDQVPLYDVSSGTTKRATVTNFLAGVKDGTLISDDVILARHINWAGTGANGGIWWEELGRTTLGVAGDTISVASFSARKYLKIISAVTATGGTLSVTARFNNDSATNYAQRYSDLGGADTTLTSNNGLVFRPAVVPSGGNAYTEAELSNISAVEKVGVWRAGGTITATGAGTAPARIEGSIKWANTSAQITRVDLINGGTGDFAIGSELIILGHD